MRRLRSLGCAVANDAALLEPTVTSLWPRAGARIQPGPGVPDGGDTGDQVEGWRPGSVDREAVLSWPSGKRWRRQRQPANRLQTTNASPIDAPEI
jgi:hypothetical protein